MSKVLSKRKVIDLIKKTKDEVAESETAIADFAYTMLEKIDQTEIADVAPVVHGKWAFQYSSTDPKPFYSFCSHCREPIKSTRAYHIYKFCPHCGAKMKMGESEE